MPGDSPTAYTSQDCTWSLFAEIGPGFSRIPPALLGVPSIKVTGQKNALRFENLGFSNVRMCPRFRSQLVLYRCNNMACSAVRNRRTRSHFDSGALSLRK